MTTTKPFGRWIASAFGHDDEARLDDALREDGYLFGILKWRRPQVGPQKLLIAVKASQPDRENDHLSPKWFRMLDCGGLVTVVIEEVKVK